ncbi:hypothetical protein DMUE_0027 [Dictyocoela muelleri]|nr:hypothetical protein DMUE_0027 [Dictyocoela muelleri]
MHTTDIFRILKYKIKVFIIDKLTISPLISANNLYNKANIYLCDSLGYNFIIVNNFASFDNLKSSIYRLKSKYLPLTGILDTFNIDIIKFDLRNGRNFLLHSDLESEKIIILTDVEYLKRFTIQRDNKIYMDGTFKSF